MKRQSKVIVLLLCALGTAWLFLNINLAQADSSIKVGLVIRHGNGALLTRCVILDGPNVTGLDVLQAANLHLVIDYSTGPGAAVCSIDNEGCPSSNCFCECGNGGTCTYWAYYYLADGKWQYSNLGSSNRQISHGDVEGWSWGSGSFGSSGTQPPVLSFDQICAPPPAATDTPVPTDTPTPTPTRTPEPTETPGTTYTSIAQKRFWSDAARVRAGTCTTLRWEVTESRTVVFMGESVTASGSRSVCPCSATSYNLDITYADGTSQVLSLTLEVDGTCDNIVPDLVMTPEPTYTSVADVVQPVPQPTTYLTLVPVSTPTALATPQSQPSPTPETGLIAPQQVAQLTSLTTTPPPVSNTASLPRYEVEQPVSSKTTNWGGYLVFGILLMGLGVGYLVVQKYGFE